MFPISVTRPQKAWVLDEVTWEGLIEWIEADHIWVVSKAGTCLIPVGNKLVPQVLRVIVKSLESDNGIRRHVVFVKFDSLAVFDEWISIGIIFKSKISHRDTETSHVPELCQKGINPLTNANRVFTDDCLSVKVRESLTTD